MIAKPASAPLSKAFKWSRVNWRQVEAFVYQIQVRIAKSIREGRWGKARALQHLLSRSFNAKLLAIKKIISNKGSRTAGIDGVKWKGAGSRWQAALDLKFHGYRAEPLRRIYIPKKNGKRRPLGIPTLHDRAMQMLLAFGLKPIAETVSDAHSYGFREKRNLHDGIKLAFICLSAKASAQWVLEADIKACFDRISHEWLLDNIPLPRVVLRQWLKCGYMEASTFHETVSGTPQGGIISPILCNMTLDGLEDLVIKGRNDKKRRKLNIIRYADDLIVTGASPDILLNEVRPEIEAFLKVRGLEFSPEKTRVRHINQGFNFLGFSLKKYSGKLLIKPEDGKPRELLEKVRGFMKSHRGIPFHVLLIKLNRIIRGWAYAYRKAVSKQRMSYIDNQVYLMVRKWLQREHRSKTWAWISKRYYKRLHETVVFCSQYMTAKGVKWVRLFKAASLPIRYHIKIKKEARPYDPAYDDYFEARERKRLFDGMKDRMQMNPKYSKYQMA